MRWRGSDRSGLVSCPLEGTDIPPSSSRAVPLSIAYRLCKHSPVLKLQALRPFYDRGSSLNMAPHCRKAGKSRVNFNNKTSLAYHQWTRGDALCLCPHHWMSCCTSWVKHHSKCNATEDTWANCSCSSKCLFQHWKSSARLWTPAFERMLTGRDSAADFFISALNTRLLYIVMGIFVVYLVVFFFFAIFWYIAGQ